MAPPNFLKWILRTRTDGASEKTLGAEALVQAGQQAEQEGQVEEACKLYREALAASPTYLPAHLNLGIALFAIGDTTAAEASYHKAIALDSKNAFAHYNLGVLLHSEGMLSEAEQHLRLALEAKPHFPEGLVALSNVLDETNRLEEAHDQLALAIKLRPDYVGGLYNYALVANKLRLYEDAEDTIRLFLEYQPSDINGLQVLALALWGQTRWAESIEIFQRVRERVPWAFKLESKELFLLNYDINISPHDLFLRHSDFGARFEREHPVRFFSFRGSTEPERPLRIGYLSPDFAWHPIGLFMRPIIERHDRDQFAVYCYYVGEKVDEITKALRQSADHWADVSHMTDLELAKMIHDDAIDILVDLAGHTSTPKLEVFAQRPVPVQVAWMGYLNTTGLTRMHYRLCDARTDPVGIADPLHTEVLVRLPHSQWCYRPDVIRETAPSPPSVANGFVTFGSFNHTLKISPQLCAIWAEVLLRVPHSRFVCVGLTSTRKMAELLSELSMTGVDPERIEMVGRVNLSDYFAWYNQVDIALDTFPYGGGTTTFDALWMGVPVVTATGFTPSSRSAASILTALGLDDWIAPSIDEYVRVAIERANDKSELASLRRNLRQRLQSSPLMDEATFTRDLEFAYRQMWRNWCDEEINREPNAESSVAR